MWDAARVGVIGRDRDRCARCGKVKKVSWWQSLRPVPRKPSPAPSRPWYWEGNVQARLVRYLNGEGCTIRKVANTASKERGPDVIAVTSDGGELLISVKGYPQRRPQQQARHWFAAAILDIILWRPDRPDTHLGLCLPRFRKYMGLAMRTAWLRTTVPFTTYWVIDPGVIHVDKPPFSVPAAR